LFSSIVDVPGILAHDVSDLEGDDRGLLAAACMEPAACAYVACSLSRVRPGDEVVVFGAGPIGLFGAMIARMGFGAGRVHVVEPVAFRRSVAKEWADAVYDVDEFFDAAPSADVVLETSGVLDNVDRAVERLRANGRVALLARAGRALSVRAVDHLITNNISIVGSRGHLCGAFSDLLKLVRAERLPLDRAVTSVVDGLDALHQCLVNPASVVEQNCKVLAEIGHVSA
jgi:threonine dehydrogenase-like Zn-dependent dehydrogenase